MCVPKGSGGVVSMASHGSIPQRLEAAVEGTQVTARVELVPFPFVPFPFVSEPIVGLL